MKLIKPSVTLIEESNPFKKIEIVGRTCYKSTSDMTEETARKFYKGLVGRSHTAMVEHATFVFQVDAQTYCDLYGHKFLNYTYNDSENRFLISGNLRALNESGEIILLKALHEIDPMLVYVNVEFDLAKEPLPDYVTIWNIDLLHLNNLSEKEFMAHAYFTFHFVCDRGVTHEIVRHRPASYAQESTRYCNYSKDKFGGEITFIEPADYESWEDFLKSQFIISLNHAEDGYMRMLNNGVQKATPQQARAVLPNALKTELIMTANAGEFEHFFDLRSRGTTGAPHPDMKVVADMALALYEEKKNKML